MTKLRYLWAHHRVASIGFAIALCLALLFAGRAVNRVLYWSDPAHRTQAPEPWMTPGYIARSWHLRPEQVDAILGIQNGADLVGHGRPTLDRIARELDIPVAALIAKLSTGLPQAVADREDRAPQ